MKEERADAILLRIKPWLESEAPSDAPSGNAASSSGAFDDELESAETAPPETAPAEGETSFSTLDLRDRVVVMLLHDQIVRVEQVKAAWEQWEGASSAGAPPTDRRSSDALWRVVARQPGVDAEAVYAAAARVYAFEPATAILYRSRAFLREHRARFSLRERRRLVALDVLPVKSDPTPDGPRWVFATHDPARPAVHHLLAEADVPPYELRYAPAAAVRARIEEAFPGAAALERGIDETPEGAAPERDEDAPSETESLRIEGLPDLPDAVFETSPPEEAESPEEPPPQDEPARPFAGLYEELLAEAARSGAKRLHLTAEGPERQLTATFDTGGELRHTDVPTSPAAALSFMRRRARATRRTGADGGVLAYRWIEGRRRAFRITELPDRRAWIRGRAEIVVEVVE
jgi:type IV pilus assembly protein PilB